ncbi:MAG: phospholipase D-like domain-containing protein, partial [Dehalococcoidia bacterium]
MPVTLSRERSWLRFNHRVLLQTRREDIPLLERVRFLSIFAANHDEFFSARIYRALERFDSGDPAEADEYRELLREAYQNAVIASECHERLRLELAGTGFHLLDPSQLTPDERSYFGAFLAEEVAPRVDLLEIGSLAELSSRALYMAAGRDRLEYLLRLPDSVPRLLPVPGRDGAFVRLGPLVRLRSDLFLPERIPMHEMRLTRLANLELERADWDDLVQAIETRPEGRVTRLEVEASFPWIEEVACSLGLPREAAFRLPPPLDHRYIDGLADLTPPLPPAGPLRFPPLKSRRNRAFEKDPFTYMDESDYAAWHPLDDYGTVERFAQAAAKDPLVDRLRISLYRLGRDNAIAEALIEAAKAGKDVAVLLEGRARFDELQNVHWNLHFRQAGIRILPLPSGYKVHGKAFLVRRDGKHYLHLSTGNYNPANGRLYTDLSLFTADPELVADTDAFFEALADGRPPELAVMRYGLDA